MAYVTQVNIPSIISSDRMIMVNPAATSTYGSGSAQGDHNISLNPLIVRNMAMDIMRREMVQIKKKNPDLDMEKLNTMAFSSDPEMRNLFNSTVGIQTKYTWHILQEMRLYGVTDRLFNIIEQYTRSNENNFTEEVL